MIDPTHGRRHQGGGVLWHALVFVLGAGTGWFVLQFVLPGERVSPRARLATERSSVASHVEFVKARAPEIPVTPSAPTTALEVRAAGVIAPTNGTLLIPVKDATGSMREPMLLVPLPMNRPPQEPSPPAEGEKVVSTIGRDRLRGSSPRFNGAWAQVRNSGELSTNRAVVTQSTNTALTNVARTSFAQTNSPPSTSQRPGSLNKVVECQVALAHQGLSPGSIDGLIGFQTRAAIRAFQQREGLPTTGALDQATVTRLNPGSLVYTQYVVSSGDLERLQPLSQTWLGKSQQNRLDYESILELVAEETFAHPNLIRRLNPELDWGQVGTGTVVKVLAMQPPVTSAKAATIRIHLGDRTLQVFGADSNLLAHYPCSIARRVEKRPLGEELHVATLAEDPNYTFDPAVFPESAEARELGRKLILQPGPNNPVGSVWIGLDKPGYGIHGTPKPEDVGRTESHGCFRLANWNVRHLLQLVTLGTPVEVLP